MRGGGLRAYALLYLLFLYAPILLLPIFAFNSGTIIAFPLQGFTTQWFEQMWGNATLRRALGNSLTIAVSSAVLIVFIPTIGDYVTPELIGGGKIPMIANLIQVQMLALDNRPLGSALAVTAMAIVALVSIVFLLINRRFLKVRS